MIVLSFYFPNSGIPNTDLTAPELGNPGVGGTQYQILALARWLQTRAADEFKIRVYVESECSMPSSLEMCLTPNLSWAIRDANTTGTDILVIPITDTNLNEYAINALRHSNTRVVAWLHNFVSASTLAKLTHCTAIRRIVCVSREQLDLLRDHIIFRKCVFIYNGIHVDSYRPRKHYPGNGTTVTYLGALIPSKGFHRLAYVWPKIRKAVPAARLLVIGSGKLYNRQISTGQWGVADEAYEKIIRRYLSNSSGLLDSSVRFLGELGHQKRRILQSSDVGVVNPIGRTETFCISAVEFQAAGTPVVAASDGGLLDTVRHGETGFLIRSSGQLADKVVTLLKDDVLRRRLGQTAVEFVSKSFSFERVGAAWERLIRDLMLETNVRERPPVKSNCLYQLKGLREFLRIQKQRYSILRLIPAIPRLPPLASISLHELAVFLRIRQRTTTHN